jgi:hypothetical protein
MVLDNTTHPAENRQALAAFQKKVAELSRAVQGALEAANDLAKKIELMKEALHNTPKDARELMNQARAMEDQLADILRAFRGDRTLSLRYENQPPSIYGRVNRIVYGFWRSTSAPTQTMKDQYRIAGEEFEPQLEKLRRIIEKDLEDLKKAMEEAGAPWTPGRVPVWKKEKSVK